MRIATDLEHGPATVRGLGPEISVAWIIADQVFREHGLEAVLTCGPEGKHKGSSLHYSANAIDLRTRDATAAEKTAIRDKIKGRLGGAAGDFDVVLEPTHLHIEYQPKRPLNWGRA